jgi:NTE family protein
MTDRHSEPVRPRRRKVAVLLVSVGVVLLLASLTMLGRAGPLNPRLTAYSTGGYRYWNVRGDGNQEGLFVVLAFSGGGTRAAAFSYGLLEGLQGTKYRSAGGVERSLLDDVDVISSVSGGSFTAAHYALFGAEGFKDFETNFLYHDIQRDLVTRALSPWNWARLLRSDMSRSDLAADLYDDTVFKHATFATLLQRSQRRRPYLLLNATDVTLGTVFQFTQDQFDLLCSDLSAVPVARAVAASSAFPVLLSPLTLHNYADGPPCDKFPTPRWLQEGLAAAGQPRRIAVARNLLSYRTLAKDRPFVHLIDGGLSDNIGANVAYDSLTGQDSQWSLYTSINQGKVQRILVIIANARVRRDPDWGGHKRPPGVLNVLGLVTTLPMDNYSGATVERVKQHEAFSRLRTDRESFRACEALARDQCPAFTMPFELPVGIAFHAVELAFDDVKDERFKTCLNGVETSFYLPGAQVTLVRRAAQRLLFASPQFIEVMAAVDPSWRAPTVPFDSALIAEACPRS